MWVWSNVYGCGLTIMWGGGMWVWFSVYRCGLSCGGVFNTLGV